MREAMAVHPAFDGAGWGRLQHYVFREKGGEFCCLAKSFEWRVVNVPILDIRERVRGIWDLP